MNPYLKQTVPAIFFKTKWLIKQGRSPKATQGFTLVEVLLAMTITTFIALLAYSGLNTATTAANRHELQAQAMVDIQLPLSIIERDIRHAIPRTITDEYNDLAPAMSGGQLNDYLLVLTRNGWDNPRELLRSELQRIRYQFEDGQLWRESWAVLDRVDSQTSFRRTLLLEKVEVIELRFLDGNSAGAGSSPIGGEWIDSWNKDLPEALPLAIEISVEIESLGEVRRVFSIPAS